VRAGRFAPSPTGPLHLGSLATALASWLDAKANADAWFVRIEDLDPPREEAHAAELILRQLLAHGLVWDHFPAPPARENGVLYQHDRSEAYAAALEKLINQGQAYACTCSRKTIQEAHAAGQAHANADGEIIYPGFCRNKDNRAIDSAKRVLPLRGAPLIASLSRNQSADQSANTPQIAWRFRNPNGDDFILRRADGYWAYHLAVVVDDEFQGITDIVRGRDLFVSAERHNALRLALGFSQPRLLHVPVILNAAGEKLSKQTQAPALRIDSSDLIRDQLRQAWQHLEAQMPSDWTQHTRPIFNSIFPFAAENRW